MVLGRRMVYAVVLDMDAGSSVAGEAFRRPPGGIHRADGIADIVSAIGPGVT